jgi:general secretion pathway protein L
MKKILVPMATTVLLLPTDMPAPVVALDYAVLQEGAGAVAARSTALSLLPAALRGAQGGDLVLVVPAACLSWHLVQLPVGAAKSGRLQSVLEALLEEQVLDELGAVHVALPSPRPAQGACRVAVCDKAWLQAWVRALEQTGLEVGAIVPAHAPMSEGSTEGYVAVTGTENQPELLQVSARGVLRLPLQAATVAYVSPPANWPVFAEPAVAALAEQLLGRPVQLQTRVQRAVLASQGSWDLAQWGLVASRGGRRLKRLSAALRTVLQAPRWRPLRWSMAALLAVNIAGLNLYAYQQQAAVRAERQAMVAVLQSSFPAVTVVLDAPLQMQRELARLQQSSGQLANTDLEAMLSAVGETAQNTEAPRSLDYAAGELQLVGLQPAPAAQAGWQQALKARGYRVQSNGSTMTVQAEAAP